MFLDTKALAWGATWAILFAGVQTATPAQWRGRSIYQVFTDRFARTDLSTTASCSSGYQGYCGGTFRGIASKLDYIQGMGFDAIWISPVVEQVADRSRGYHGYSAQNLYTLNGNFGSSDDLKALAAALHSRGMYLMIDVVPNHMAYDGSAETVNYGMFNPFNDGKYFHPICWITDYNNQTNLEDCWLGTDAYPLPDLDTTQTGVRNMYNSWIQYMISTYSIDGIRIDSVKNVEKPFWPGFTSASGVFSLGEVSNGDINYACDYQNYMDGILGYPLYYQLTYFYSNPSVTSYNLVNSISYLNQVCKDTTLLGSFSENHDQARFASYTSDLTLAKNIITHTILSDGVPIIYAGQEQHFNGGADPYDREALWLSGYSTQGPLYQLVKSLNAIRQLAIARSADYLTWHSQVVYSDSHNIAVRKGTASYMTLMVTNNLGSAAQDYTVRIPNAGFPPGLTVVDVLSCRVVVVDGTAGLNAHFTQGLPMVYYPFFLLSGTGWCGF